MKTVILSKPESFVICSGLSLVFMKTVIEREGEGEMGSRERKKKNNKGHIFLSRGFGT